MAVLHDFRCDAGHVSEHFVPSDTTSVQCPLLGCGKPAHRVYLRAPRIDWLGMAQGANAGPEFIDRFEKIHRKEKEREEKIFKEHGDYGPNKPAPPST